MPCLADPFQQDSLQRVENSPKEPYGLHLCNSTLCLALKASLSLVCALLPVKLLLTHAVSVVKNPISGAASSDKDDKDNLKDLPAYLEYVQGEFSDVDVANRISMFDKELCVTDSDGDHAAEFYEVDGDLLVRTLPVENQVIMI